MEYKHQPKPSTPIHPSLPSQLLLDVYVVVQQVEAAVSAKKRPRPTLSLQRMAPDDNGDWMPGPWIHAHDNYRHTSACNHA